MQETKGQRVVLDASKETNSKMQVDNSSEGRKQHIPPRYSRAFKLVNTKALKKNHLLGSFFSIHYTMIDEDEFDEDEREAYNELMREVKKA